MEAGLGVMLFLCAVISGKWAMELRFNQVRQLLYFVGGLLLGPLIPLVLYLYLLRERKTGGAVV